MKTLVYLKTNPRKLQYSRTKKGDLPSLKVYVDSDFAADRDTRKSTSGVSAFHNTNMVNWIVKNQKSVALSTMEAEYMALCEATKEALYLKQLFTEIGMMLPDEPVLIMEDNQACKLISRDAQHHTRAKHIDVQYHFSREAQQKGKTKVVDVHTQRQLADYLTKYVHPIVLDRLSKAAFGHDTSFHYQDPTTPLVTQAKTIKTDRKGLSHSKSTSSMNMNKLRVEAK